MLNDECDPEAEVNIGVRPVSYAVKVLNRKYQRYIPLPRDRAPPAHRLRDKGIRHGVINKRDEAGRTPWIPQRYCWSNERLKPRLPFTRENNAARKGPIKNAYLRNHEARPS
ncbi:hypothetical protein EVAR_93804_1 [Eumeta japonica]|uniref:Uncharacterized protein n=1 Tax=Eumeta variegata TaxID=151549 RepID=A0A4C1VB72_EUMVA|nr:hypothetical protein EVAR_93804_1 [Eumeta japonica]